MDNSLDIKKESIITNLAKDKLNLFFIILILTLGIFLRFNDYNGVSYGSDDESTIPTGLLWFYPHTSYPGLSGVGEPALGNFFVGLGCMISGEDFSGVSQIRPMFYPGRSSLIGEALAKAEPYCFFPIYFFGILFLIAISLFALLTLPKYSATFIISFIAFSPFILSHSRWMHVDIILFFFVVSALLFLWLAYKSDKGGKKEILFFIISFVLFALAFSTKLPAAAHLLFAIFLILEKYKSEFLSTLKKSFEKLGLNSLIKPSEGDKLNTKTLIKILAYSLLSYLLVLLVTFEFNLKNIFATIQTYNSHGYNINAFGLTSKFYLGFIELLQKINIFDTIVFSFAFYIMIRILFKKNKTKFEKFALYSALYLILLCLLFQIVMMLRVFFIFAIGFFFLASLIFSNEEYSIFAVLRIKKVSLVFYALIIVYITFSFTSALNDSPYFSIKNPIFCYFKSEECLSAYSNSREVANLVKSDLNDNETFIGGGLMIYYYTRQDESLPLYIFNSNFNKQIGREPKIADYLQYYHPSNRTVRYVIIEPHEQESYGGEGGVLLKGYIPLKTLKIKDKDSAYLYDLFNLKKR